MPHLILRQSRCIDQSLHCPCRLRIGICRPDGASDLGPGVGGERSIAWGGDGGLRDLPAHVCIEKNNQTTPMHIILGVGAECKALPERTAGVHNRNRALLRACGQKKTLDPCAEAVRLEHRKRMHHWPPMCSNTLGLLSGDQRFRSGCGGLLIERNPWPSWGKEGLAGCPGPLNQRSTRDQNQCNVAVFALRVVQGLEPCWELQYCSPGTPCENGGRCTGHRPGHDGRRRQGNPGGCMCVAKPLCIAPPSRTAPSHSTPSIACVA